MSSSGSLSQWLKSARAKQEKSLQQASERTGISTEFIIALEDGDFLLLADDPYTTGKIRSYAQFLDISPDKAEQLYREERGETKSSRSRPLQLAGKVPAPIVTTSLMRQAGVVLAIVAIVAYIAWQVLLLAGNPQLQVTSPGQDEVIIGSEVEIVGTTTPGSQVTIDGQPVLVADDGSFYFVVDLDEGVYELSLEARSKLGRTTTLERTVVVENPED